MSKIQIGTVVAIGIENGHVVARDHFGKNVTGHVPSHVLRKVNEIDDYTVELRATLTGGEQWRRVERSSYTDAVAMHSNMTAALPKSAALDLSSGDVAPEDAEDLDEHGKFVAFVQNSYSLKPDRLKIPKVLWQFAIRNILREENTLFRGPSGSGKSMMAEILATVLNRPYFEFNFGAIRDARGSLIGNTHFNKDKGTFLSKSEFIRAIETPNAIINLDELSRATDAATNLILPLLNPTQRFVRLDEHEDSPVIEVAKGVAFVSTANVGSEYTGTREMDAALIDRFSILDFEYLSLEDETALLVESFPSLSGALIQAVAEIATATRCEIKSESPKYDAAISTRRTVKLAALLHDGFSLAEAAEVMIYPMYSKAGGTEAQQTYVRTLVQKYIVIAESKKANPSNKAMDPNVDPNSGFEKPW